MIDPEALTATLQRRLWEWEDVAQDISRGRLYAEGKVSAYREALELVALLDV